MCLIYLVPLSASVLVLLCHEMCTFVNEAFGGDRQDGATLEEECEERIRALQQYSHLPHPVAHIVKQHIQAKQQQPQQPPPQQAA